jgi:predicted ribosomally synthesized peptide with nif11-like leader
MSQEAAQACVARMKTDEAFREKVMAADGVDARIEIVNAEGFTCTADEIKAHADELADAEMATVVGGLLACGVAACGPAACGAAVCGPATDPCGVRMSEQAL